MDEPAAIRARVTGLVQGVCFRAFVRDEAQRLGLRGWVRNERDGSVAALFAGPQPALREIEAALRRGPTAARVTDVEIAEAGDEPPPEDFRILR